MKNNRNHHKSLTRTIGIYFIIYSLFIIGIYSFITFWSSKALVIKFPYLDDLLEYEDALMKDDFSAIPVRQFRNSSFLIFSEDGEVLYANNDKISTQISKDDLSVINAYYEESYYEVLKKETDDGQINYYVFLNSYDSDTDTEQIKDFCILDKDYKVIEGNLFQDRGGYLTEREFELIHGTFQHKMDIDKYEYDTTDGEARTLVFLCPKFSYKDYNAQQSIEKYRWILACGLIILIIIAMSVLFRRRIKKSLLPLKQVMMSYRDNSDIAVDTNKIPQEFKEVMDCFSLLMNRLEAANQEKDSIYEEKQQMVSDISHDLKTPLTVIYGYADAFLQGLVPENKKQKYMESIHDKSAMAAELIDSLLTYTKMERTDFQLNLESVDFCDFVKQILAEQYLQLDSKGYPLQVDIPEKTVELSIDKVLMRRLFENLISNTLKYNEPGTKIYVSMKTHSMEESNEAIVLTIADDGIGITDDIACSLFEPFVTGNAARTSGKGTGLGLSIVKKIVDIHGGEIKLVYPASAPYSIEFQIILPIEQIFI